MDLTAAYRNLQLDPNKTQQVTAFEALCWKHLFHHASPQWVHYAQSGALPLTWVTHVNEKRLQEYDDTLDTIVEDFVRVYADISPLACYCEYALTPHCKCGLTARCYSPSEACFQRRHPTHREPAQCSRHRTHVRGGIKDWSQVTRVFLKACVDASGAIK